MRFTFLGGADEVGASCTLVHIEDKHILVDCGIRMGSDAHQTPMPALELLNDIKLDALILTHAHMDHLGAMPLVCALYPGVPVWMTPATLEIAQIMLRDALKLQALWWEMGARVPLFGEQAVHTFLAAVRLIDFEEVVELVPGVRAAFYRAGHILGAACVLLESKRESVLLGGDISVAEQLTIPGAQLPAGLSPDVMLLESTYGGRTHAPRSDELARLVEQAAKVLAQGGSVLYPSFAIGRAQEILLCLSRAQEDGELADVPIYVDGLVKSVCGVFRSHKGELTRWLSKRVDRIGNPFWGEGSHVRPIWSPAERERVGVSGPCLIVASSGMLTGGPSLFYAQKLAPNSANLIAITGYQDGESPGRKLLDMAAAGGGELEVDSKRVQLACKMATYNLSGHADMRELLGLVSAIKPAHVVLVHGGASQREAMQSALVHGVGCEVHRPALGSTLEFTGSRSGFLSNKASSVAARKKAAKPSLQPNKPKTPVAPVVPRVSEVPQAEAGLWAPESVEQLMELAHRVFMRDGAGKDYTTSALMLAWAGAPGARQQVLVAKLKGSLGQEGSPFMQDKTQPGVWRLILDKQGAMRINGAACLQRELRRSVQQTQDKAREHVQRVLAPHGLLAMKFKPAQQLISLQFRFARVAQQTCASVVEQLREETGWRVVIQADYVHQQALMEAADELMPAAWTPRGRPALHLEQRRVAVKVEAGAPDAALVDKVSAAYLAKTGFVLDVQLILPLLVAGKVVAASVVHAMELNQALHIIRASFEQQAHQPLKMGVKAGTIELAFISQQVGERYQDRIDGLSVQTGYPLKIRAQPDQSQIRAWLERRLDQHPLENFGFHGEAGYVRLKLGQPLDVQAWDALAREFEQDTGFVLFVWCDVAGKWLRR
jgi:Cft2 family RNA processing exonuclease